LKITLEKSTYILTAILVVIMIVVIIVTANQLYSVAIDEEKERLTETVKSQARLIEAVASFDRQFSQHDVVGGPEEATLSQIRMAHSQYEGFGKTGEFTLAKLVDERISFLLRHRNKLLKELSLPEGNIMMGSHLAIPMQLALSGQSGTVVGKDY